MGEDVLEASHAWSVYDEFRADPRVILLPEQTLFEDHWRQAGKLITGALNAWTDAYLAAFGVAADATIVTFDRRFKALGSCDVLTLS